MGFLFGKSRSLTTIEYTATDASGEGSVNIMRYGAGPNGVMRTLGQYMLGSGAAFGSVKSIRLIARGANGIPSAFSCQLEPPYDPTHPQYLLKPTYILDAIR